MARARIPVMALLECGDQVSFNPPAKKGESVICRRHGETTVKEPLLAQWTAECDGCGFARGYGQARLRAEIEGAKHRKRVRFPDQHVVKIFNPDGNLHHTYGVENRSQLSFGDVTES